MRGNFNMILITILLVWGFALLVMGLGMDRAIRLDKCQENIRNVV